MQVESVVFQHLEDEPAEVLEHWKMRVVVHGEGFETRALPMVLEVGEQRAQMLFPLIDIEGDVVGVQGLLPEIPAQGEEVKVGFVDGPLLASGHEFIENES